MFYNLETKKADGFCLIKSLEEKTASSGNPYLDLVLGDKDNEIKAKVWGSDKLKETFEAFQLVKIRGTVDAFNGENQLKIADIRHVTEADSVNIADFVPCAPFKGEQMLNYIIGVVNGFTDGDYKKLVMSFIDSNREKLLYWPAATKMHHAINGGLLYHTSTMLKTANAVYDIYNTGIYEGVLNRDLLFTGVILHDFSKLEEIDSSDLGIASDYTVKGNLLGHLVMGAMDVDRRGRELGIPEEKLLLVEHMLVSHHGIPEWGACKKPEIIEAELLSHIDMIDAKLYAATDGIKDVEEGTLSPKIFAVGNVPFYKHA